MIGLCSNCDKYAYFNEVNNFLQCSNCDELLPLDYKDHFFNEAIEVKYGKQTLTIEPTMVQKTINLKASELISYLHNKNKSVTDRVFESFHKELELLKKLAYKDNLPTPVVLILNSSDGNGTIAIGVRVTPEGDILAPKSQSSKKSKKDEFNYIEYLRSSQWYEKRVPILKRAEFKCQICNSKERLEVHHRTYENIGHELENDLTVLCHICHALFSKHGRLASH